MRIVRMLLQAVEIPLSIFLLSRRACEQGHGLLLRLRERRIRRLSDGFEAVQELAVARRLGIAQRRAVCLNVGPARHDQRLVQEHVLRGLADEHLHFVNAERRLDLGRARLEAREVRRDVAELGKVVGATFVCALQRFVGRIAADSRQIGGAVVLELRERVDAPGRAHVVLGHGGETFGRQRRRRQSLSLETAETLGKAVVSHDTAANRLVRQLLAAGRQDQRVEVHVTRLDGAEQLHFVSARLWQLGRVGFEALDHAAPADWRVSADGASLERAYACGDERFVQTYIGGEHLANAVDLGLARGLAHLLLILNKALEDLPRTDGHVGAQVQNVGLACIAQLCVEAKVG
eukprot:3800033-Pleurochrysis_carterae.AAC.2